ncbi:MAG: prolyl oligopeptidase family serine peptidase, partial [Planctomycetes bacterium]|nr:prolyl oligopeptidase family serine peptidase [Planctomycetota bacterium]
MPFRSIAGFLAFSFLWMSLAASAQDEPRGMQPADYYDFQMTSDAQISPDGERVVFVLTTVAEDRRSRETSLWLVPSDSSEPPRRFTRATSDHSPRWAPDGSAIAFLSSRGERAQLYTIPVDGGEARAITALEQGSISGFEWLPDGAQLLLTLSIDPAVEDPTQEAEEPEEPQPDTTIVTTALYRTGPGSYLDESRQTLWLLSLEDAELKPLVADAAYNVNNAAVSPRGTHVAFNADKTGEEFDAGFNQDIHVLRLEDGEVRTLQTPDRRAERPVWSPDGQHLIYHHQADRYQRTELHRIAVEGGEPEVIHDGMALTTSRVQWPAGHEQPFFRADYRGSRPIFQLAAGGAYNALTGQRASYSPPSFSADGSRMAYVRHNETTLPEVWVARADGTDAQQLSSFNKALLDTLVVQPYERFSFTHDGGGEADAFVLKPLGYAEGNTYPLVLNIKGGPGGMWGHQWFHEMQMLAAAGYGVVFTNYRGSTGYGHEFQSEVRLDYSGVDFRDNMTVVDEALARFDWIDEERLFVTGGSHGGFLTNWITTQTDRFRAAVTQRSVSNWISETGTQAFPPRQMNAEFGGSLWNNFDYYWDRSPLQFADRVTTPTLIIHSEQDHITPIGQGQEWFYALKNAGVPVEMVMFEGEGH